MIWNSRTISNIKSTGTTRWGNPISALCKSGTNGLKRVLQKYNLNLKGQTTCSIPPAVTYSLLQIIYKLCNLSSFSSTWINNYFIFQLSSRTSIMLLIRYLSSSSSNAFAISIWECDVSNLIWGMWPPVLFSKYQIACLHFHYLSRLTGTMIYINWPSLSYLCYLNILYKARTTMY